MIACALCFWLCALCLALCALCCVLCVLCFVLGALSAFCFVLMLCALWTVPVCDLESACACDCEVWLWLCHTVAPHPIMFHVSINMTWFPGLVYNMPHPHKFVITQSLHQDLVSRACCCSTSPHLMCLSVYHMPTHCWTYPEILS